LGTIYLQLEQTFTCDNPDPSASWLPKVREGCLATAEELPRLRLPGILGIVSAVVAVGGLLSKLPGWVGGASLAIAGGLAVDLWILYPSMRASYLYKRSLFLHDAKRVDKEGLRDQADVRDNNVYWLENELFDLLRWGKRREVEIDKLFPTIGVGLIWYGAIGFTLWRSNWHFDQWFHHWPTYVAITAGLVALLLLSRHQRRAKRAWL
jgi:hypothetical protein